jgi:hypothetical protein
MAYRDGLRPLNVPQQQVRGIGGNHRGCRPPEAASRARELSLDLNAAPGASMNVSLPSSSKKLSERSFTHLKVHIVEEDGAFTVRVRLLNEVEKDEGAWGEETAATFDQASAMIDALAAEFSIPQTCISIKIVMNRFQDGTMH